MSYFQITYYVKYQFHKAFLLGLTEAGEGFQGDTAHSATASSVF